MSLEALEKSLPIHLRQWAREFHGAGTIYRLCPYLLAAVCDRESRGGLALSPQGPAGTGDKGHGRGIMQADDRFHVSFVSATDGSGKHLWKQAPFNVLYGAKLLRDNLDALLDVSLALSAYNAGVARVRAASDLVSVGPDDATTLEMRRKAADAKTTGGNYGADVLRRRAQWAPPDAPLVR